MLVGISDRAYRLSYGTHYQTTNSYVLPRQRCQTEDHVQTRRMLTPLTHYHEEVCHDVCYIRIIVTCGRVCQLVSGQTSTVRDVTNSSREAN